mgnify:CR=1 FL=1
MFDFKSVPIPPYTGKEDIINSVTHAIGVPFAVAAAVLLLKKNYAELDGKYFDLNDAPSVPVHPCCRCALIPVVDDWKPSERMDNSTRETIDYKTYAEWRNE